MRMNLLTLLKSNIRYPTDKQLSTLATERLQTLQFYDCFTLTLRLRLRP
jgi:hypothetical protein